MPGREAPWDMSSSARNALGGRSGRVELRRGLRTRRRRLFGLERGCPCQLAGQLAFTLEDGPLAAIYI